jgi:hypothetical protein
MTTIGFGLEAGDAQEEVTVIAEAATVEKTSSTVSSTISLEAVDNLPVATFWISPC